MENIVLIGHGSPKPEANTIGLVGALLHNAIHPGCSEQCVKVAYLQFAEPGIMDAIKECAKGGAQRIILHPFFLNAGMHVTKDIPEMIGEARSLYPDVEFVYTEPLGIHEKLVQVIIDRIRSATFESPADIETRSLEILSEETDLGDLHPEQIPVVRRVIHSTADFEFRKSLLFHPDAVKTGIDAIRSGRDILTDIEMVRAGINKKLLGKWGGKVICNIAEEEVIAVSEKTGRTRAEISIERGLAENVGIVAVGNAPTALLKVIELLTRPFDRGRIPGALPLVVGVPVGFVKALESKALLATQKFPFITNLGRKGGTPVAVAIVNALLKMADKAE